MSSDLCDLIINSMFELAICPNKTKFSLRNKSKWQRNDLSMIEVLDRLKKQYPPQKIFAAVKAKLENFGLLLTRSDIAIDSNPTERAKILYCLHLLSESEQQILTNNEVLNLLPHYPCQDYRGNFIAIAKKHHIDIAQMLTRVLTEIGSNDIETVISWLKVFCCYQYYFDAPDDIEKVMTLISKIESRINTIKSHTDVRIRKCVTSSEFTINLFRDEYLDPFEPGKPFA
ncbi:MAG: hypothetical protein NXI29_28565 [bacterium]|nr:hypothetical protein [bacterium]